MNKAFAHAEIKEVKEDKSGDLIIHGVASTGNLDRTNEIVDQESLAKCCDGNDLTLFYMHSWDSVIGKVLELAPSENQLDVVASIGKDFEFPYFMGTLNVNDVRKQIEEGYLKALSIGFQANRKTEEDDDGNALPTKLIVTDLLELSVVSIPANKDCTFSLAKCFENNSTVMSIGGDRYNTDLFTKVISRTRFQFQEEPADGEFSEEDVFMAQTLVGDMKSLRGIVGG